MGTESLTFKVVPGPDQDVIVFDGPLTEKTSQDLSAIRLPSTLKRSLVLDLAGIKHVNSTGIASWIPFISGLAKVYSLTMRRCSPTFIMSSNIFEAMLGKAKVESVSRGYECPKQHYWWIDVETAGLDPETADDAKVVCGKCGLRGKPEYDADEYFRFLEP